MTSLSSTRHVASNQNADVSTHTKAAFRNPTAGFNPNTEVAARERNECKARRMNDENEGRKMATGKIFKSDSLCVLRVLLRLFNFGI